MEKSRITLQSYLEKYGWLKYGMIVKGTLIKELEIYGFVNSSKEMIDELKSNQFNLLGIVNKAPNQQVIRGFYMYQVVEWFDGENVKQTGLTTPIYIGLRNCREDIELNIADLHIPNLISNNLYCLIRSRRGTGVEITPQLVNKYKAAKIFADNNIIIKEGNAFLQVKKGDTLCIHALDHSVKSIGQELVAICRYVCKTTGHLRYALFDLSELTIEDCEVEGYNDLL